MRAWTWIGALANSSWRFGLHAGLIALASALVATLLDPLLGHGISRISFGTFSLGKSVTTIARLWMVASFFGFLAVEAVVGLEWLTNLASPVALHPDAGAVAGGFNSSRRTFFQYAACVAGSIPFLAATYGFAEGRLRYTVERVDVSIANLPRELDGLRIAQLSDIHIGDYMPPHEIARAVDMANELRPDISFVTGDFVSGEGDPLDVCIRELSRLRAPLGVWGCNGNHEIYAGVEDDAEQTFPRERDAIVARPQRNHRAQWRTFQSDRRRLSTRSHGERRNSGADLAGDRVAGAARYAEYFTVAQSEFVSARGGVGNRVEPRGAHAWWTGEV